jgi:ubiquinone/menaquinone biosynthesis C-methylase UbiE
MTEHKIGAHKEYYDSIASGYDELHSEEQLKKLELIGKEIVNDSRLKDFISSSDKLLDVGCGTGISTGFFKAKEKHGIDPSSELIKIAIKHNPLIKFKVERAEELPYTDKEFNIVISLTAIQNFTNISKGLDEIKRVGKKFILTFLKRSQKREIIEKIIQGKFKILKKIEEDKDIIYFCE